MIRSCTRVVQRHPEGDWCEPIPGLTDQRPPPLHRQKNSLRVRPLWTSAVHGFIN